MLAGVDTEIYIELLEKYRESLKAVGHANKAIYDLAQAGMFGT